MNNKEKIEFETLEKKNIELNEEYNKLSDKINIIYTIQSLSSTLSSDKLNKIKSILKDLSDKLKFYTDKEFNELKLTCEILEKD